MQERGQLAQIAAAPARSGSGQASRRGLFFRVVRGCIIRSRPGGILRILFCMPLEEGQKLVESLDGVEAMWCTPDQQAVASSGWESHTRQ